MKKLIVYTVLLSTFAAHGQVRWDIMEDYTIAFSGKKAEGTFRELEGVIRFDSARLDVSGFDVSVAVETIATGNSTKDKHARGESWLDAARFPRISYVTDVIRKSGSADFEAIGVLSLKGVTKPMNFRFRFHEEGGKGVFSGTMKLNRQDFGIAGNFFGFVVGDEFEIQLTVPVQKIE